MKHLDVAIAAAMIAGPVASSSSRQDVADDAAPAAPAIAMPAVPSGRTAANDAGEPPKIA